MNLFAVHFLCKETAFGLHPALNLSIVKLTKQIIAEMVVTRNRFGLQGLRPGNEPLTKNS